MHSKCRLGFLLLIGFIFQACDSSEHGYIIDERDGIKYEWVQIGDQKWLKDNLAFLPSINLVSEQSDSIPMYYVYGNEETSVDEAKNTKILLIDGEEISTYDQYGVLYNFAAIRTENKICPKGWHIPTDEEWKQLEMTLGIDKAAIDFLGHRPEGELGHRLKDSVGWANHGNGLDEVGLAIKPGGACFSGSNYHSEGTSTVFWSSTEDEFGNGMVREFSCCESGIVRDWEDQRDGYSVRCVR